MNRHPYPEPRDESAETGVKVFVVAVALWAVIASLLYLTRGRWPETVVTGLIAAVLCWSVWRAE